MKRRPDLALMPDGTPIRLAAGAHASPEKGVCVVELASLIAKEEFGDRPGCVCPVIAAFLRGWNDRAPHAERQRLGPYASRIVGSRADRGVTRERRDLCLEWAGIDLGHGGVRGLAAKLVARLRIGVFCGLRAALRPNEGAGDYAARIAAVRGEEERAFELLDTLLAIGAERPPEPFVPSAGNGHRPLNGDAPPPIPVNGHRASNGNGNGNGAARRPSGARQAVPAGSRPSD
jgi:hypothetical protein